MTAKIQNNRLEDSLPLVLSIATALFITTFAVILGLQDTGVTSVTSTNDVASPDQEKAYSSSKNIVSKPEHVDAGIEGTMPPSSSPPPQTEEDVEHQPRPGAARYAETMQLDLPYLSFQTRFPVGSSDDPVYRDIMEQVSRYREKLLSDAAQDRDSRNEIDAVFQPWDVDIIVREIARNDVLVSAVAREFSYTGGAHPNLRWQGLIADTQTGEKLTLKDLFLPRSANSPALIIAACEELKVQKLQRIQETTVNGDQIDCGSEELKGYLNSAEFVLTRSTEDGKFAGIAMLFAPYILGPYSEGPYTLIVSHDVFAQDLRPNIKILFAGESMPLPAN